MIGKEFLFLSQATPHTRGSTLIREGNPPTGQGYPAYAGIDHERPIFFAFARRLPRIRGDRPYIMALGTGKDGATPHTRGSTRNRLAQQWRDRGYPAYAGIDLLTCFLPL